LEKPDLYVLARFLDIMHHKGIPMRRTNVQMLLGLNYARFTEYLDWVTAHGLIVEITDDERSDEDDIGKLALTPKAVDGIVPG
jgi:predicted transcriptional regulator